MRNYLKYGKQLLEKVVTWFNRLPNNTYPAGLDAYNASIAKWGQENIWAPHNIWRQVFHFTGGVLLAVALTPWIHPFQALVTAILISIKESKDGINKLKNYVDLLVWIAGSIAVTLTVTKIDELLDKIQQVF